MSDQVSSVVKQLATDIVATFDAEIRDIIFTQHNQRAVLRVVVEPLDDTVDSVDIDVIARLSRKLAKSLDDADPIPTKYVLEVTTPGADQALTTPRDFRRNLTRTLVVEYASHDTPLTGTLDAVNDDTIVLTPKDGEAVTVKLAEITAAHVVLPW